MKMAKPGTMARVKTTTSFSLTIIDVTKRPEFGIVNSGLFY